MNLSWIRREQTLLLALLLTSLLHGCIKDDAPDQHVGYVEAQWRYIAAPSSGWLISQKVSEGSEIHIGDVLFSLDDRTAQADLAQASALVDEALAQAENVETGARPAEIRVLEAQLATAQAQLQQARADRDRVLPLVKRGLEPAHREDQVIASYKIAASQVRSAKEAVAVARLDGRDGIKHAAKAAIFRAQAARDAAEVVLAERTIAARLSGLITEVYYRPGEFVPTGAPVLAVQTSDALKVRFFVNQHELPQLSLGAQISVTADGMTAPVTGRVSYISKSAEFTPPVIYSQDVRDKLVFLIEASVPGDAPLLPGLPVDVDWP